MLKVWPSFVTSKATPGVKAALGKLVFDLEFVHFAKNTFFFGSPTFPNRVL